MANPPVILRTNPSFFMVGLLASPLETASLKTTVSVSLEVFKLVDEISGALLSNRLTVLLVCVLVHHNHDFLSQQNFAPCRV